MKQGRMPWLAVVIAAVGTGATAVGAMIQSLNGSALEGGGPATIVAVLTVPATVTFNVDYALTDDTAEAGRDYRPQTGTLIFTLLGESYKSVEIPNPVVDNGTVDGDRTIRLAFMNATGGVELPSAPASCASSTTRPRTASTGVSRPPASTARSCWEWNRTGDCWCSAR